MSRSTLPDELSDDATAWELPFVEDTRGQDDGKTNAFNRRSDWKYEPPEPEEEILPPTAEEIEAIRAAAYQDGFEQGKLEGAEKGFEEGLAKGLEQGLEEGKAQGLEQGMAEGQAEIQQQAQVWQQLLQQLQQPVAQVEETLEKELVTLAVSLARSVIRAETATNENIIFQALSEGLKVLPIGEKTYQIHLNPQDIELIKQHFDEQEIEKHRWVFVEAPHMTRGGCDITTDNNAVDVSVDRRCRDVLDKFLLEQGLSQIDPE